jgi:hypothetical protein
MANEIENVLHAAIRVNGTNNQAVVEAGAGFDDATVMWVADGDYLVTLTEGIDQDESICSASVEEAGAGTARINIEQLNDTQWRVTTFDGAYPGVLQDAVWSLIIWRARTGQ